MASRGHLTRQEILQSLRANQDVLKNYGVRRIGIFGSYAAGKRGSKGDIDFLVEFEEPTFDNFLGLSRYLEKLFRKKADILTPGALESIRVKEVGNNIRRSVIFV